MQSFLQLVAHDLYTKIGNDLSRTVLVFPNKRANLFFNEYLAGESDKPIWSPAAMSISDLFQKLSVQKSGDPIRLVCELYKVFKEETRSQETLDDFYFWGELLISDFDDVDKNMVDADKLFGNLQDLKNLMDDYEFLDKEQEEAIQQFFQNFSIEKRTELKEKFISLWDKLGTIYHRYRANLTELGIAYEGMLYRNVIEQLDTDQLKYDKYIFVGFNVLNKVESDFFRKLKDAGKALFYWDYDIFYTQQIKKHEAGEFLKRNLEEFPNELPESFFNTFKEPKKIRYISASTENAQARFLPGWIKAITNDHSQITVEKEKENVYISSLILYSDAVEALSIDEYDYRDENIDFYGECFYNLCQDTFNSIISENFDRFKKLYEKLIMVTIICDEIIHKIIDINYNDNYKLSKYKIPMLQFMDISGYAIYYSHLTNKKEWEEIVSCNFQKVLSISKDKDQFMKKLVATASVDFNTFSIDILKSDFKLIFQQFVKNSNYLKYKNVGPFSQKVVDSNDNLLNDFTFLDGEFYNDFYEIFIYYYVNPEVEDFEKYKVHFSHE